VTDGSPPSPDRLLTAADERRLFRRIERGDRRARDEMIERNLRLVHALARRYRGGGVPFEDLVQEGTVGLVRAVERFDHQRGLKFSTYAVWWIRRALADAIAAARPIRLPTGAVRGLAAVRHAESELRAVATASPTSEAIAARTGLSVGRVQTLHGAARVTASLDDPVREDATPLRERVPDPSGADPWRRLEEHETRRQVRAMVRLLPERHREVVVRRYGLQDDIAQTHAEIASSLGVGEERTRQLEREGLHRLRELGGGWRLAA
jgi:RNA polymerase primary sigma factor